VQTTFNDLKATLSNAPLISPPNYDHDYTLYLSTSTILVAGVLIQLGDDGREHVIYYISKNLSGPPLKYNHEDKLALVVVLIVQKLTLAIVLTVQKLTLGFVLAVQKLHIPNPCSTYLVNDKLMANFPDGSSSFRSTT
jgi:hypothetical protein